MQQCSGQFDAQSRLNAGGVFLSVIDPILKKPLMQGLFLPVIRPRRGESYG